MRIELYNPSSKALWDDFVRQSKNGTFLFLRDYMDYHADRFVDYSLLVFDEGEKPAALLPAHRREQSLSSHGGLTYGGFVTAESMKLPKLLEVFEETFRHLRTEGIEQFNYKTVPHIYHRLPAEEDRYALFLTKARLVRRGVMTVSDARLRPPFQERRRRGAKKAEKSGLIVRESEDLASYWQLLTERLRQVYDTRPVHSLNEIEMLHRRFPQNIRLWAAFEGELMVAGVLIHETERVARSQYIAAQDRGQQLGALDSIFTELLTKHYATKAYFDFGTSDEEDGQRLNRGLIDQKEGYGARVVVHDHYEIDITNCRPGQFIGAMDDHS